MPRVRVPAGKPLPKQLKRSREIPVGGAFGGAPSPMWVTNMPTRVVPETKLEKEVVFAGAGTSTAYRKQGTLAKLYGCKPSEWFHSSGKGWVFDPADGRIRLAELHWAEEPSVGVRELRHKRWAR